MALFGLGKIANHAEETFGPEGEWWSGCVGRCTGKYLRGEHCDVDKFGDCTKKYGKCFGKCNRQLGNRAARSFNRTFGEPRERVTTFTEDVCAASKEGLAQGQKAIKRAAQVGKQIVDEVRKGGAQFVDALKEGVDFYEQPGNTDGDYTSSDSDDGEDTIIRIDPDGREIILAGYNNTADNNFILAGFL